MPYLQQSRPHPNNPLGAALQSLGGSVSQYGAQQRQERQVQEQRDYIAEQIAKADEKANGALSEAMRALQGGPGKPLYSPMQKGTSPEQQAMDPMEILKARIGLAKNAPGMVSFFDKEVDRTRAEQAKAKGSEPFQFELQRGMGKWVPDENAAKVWAQIYADAKSPSEALAGLKQAEGEFLKQQADQLNVQRLDQLWALALQSDAATKYISDDNPAKTGIHAFTSDLSVDMKGMKPEEQIRYLSARVGSPEAQALSDDYRRIRKERDQARQMGTRQKKEAFFEDAKRMIRQGNTVEGLAMFDMLGVPPEVVQRFMGEGKAQTEFKGSRAWVGMAPEEQRPVVKELMLMLEQGASEKKIKAYIEAQDISVTDDELAEAVRAYQASWKGMVPKGMNPDIIGLTPEANNFASGTGW